MSNLTSNGTGIETGGQAQNAQGVRFLSFVTALVGSLIIFGVTMMAFLVLKGAMPRIYIPKTYLVPQRERTKPPPNTPWGWIFAIFQFRDREIINKCGLDAYFFLRYLQMLLVIFVPMGFLVLPTLIPLNFVGGRGPDFALENGNSTSSSLANVTGLDTLAWSNVRPENTKRYWAHCTLAVIVILWVCIIIYNEMGIFVKVRQDWLTSGEHRLRASATTILVSSIPDKWLTEDALNGLFDVFPGGVRNIWINRNYNALLSKIRYRDWVSHTLEAAETELIRKAKKAQRKQKMKEEEERVKQNKQKGETKEEKAHRLQREREEGEILAATGGVSVGDPHQVPHTVEDAILEEERENRDGHRHGEAGQEGIEGAAQEATKAIIGGLAAASHGIGNLGRVVGRGLEKGFADTVNGGGAIRGFANIDGSTSKDQENPGTPKTFETFETFSEKRIENGLGETLVITPQENLITTRTKAQEQGPRPPSTASSQATSQRTILRNEGADILGNDGDKSRRASVALVGEKQAVQENRFWEFWKPPAGGFASPIPTGYNNYSTQKDKKRSTSKSKTWKETFPFALSSWGNADVDAEPVEYPNSFNATYEEKTPAVWQKYLKVKDRPTMRVPMCGSTPGWYEMFIGIFLEKVDTIYWCREQLTRLNIEIEVDQDHPGRYPSMNSAFIQFNQQVAAHMAAQAVTYHLPQQMAPRTVEISPSDVIWENMSLTWWESWARTGIVWVIVICMIVLWAFPVAWTATLGQITTLADKYQWLHWLTKIPPSIIQGVAGILPALVLSILLAVLPMILSFLAGLGGAKTGVERQRATQAYYFIFLFVQVFLVVSISGGITAFVSAAKSITSIPETLATQLPKAANYFFSYMILQALSVSSGTLLQLLTLLLFFVFSGLFDNTARAKWHRATTLPNIEWGIFFPVYTNFACIALIYCIISPIIIVFAIITFSLLWIANRYNMLYVSRFKLDTGGLLFPRALNQTFTGLYFMELALIGLFFLVRNDHNKLACTPQAIIMIVMTFLTVIYQYLLNQSFGPLFYHLPITLEDEAVIRDEILERQQNKSIQPLDSPGRAKGWITDIGDVESNPNQLHDGIEMSHLRANSLPTITEPHNTAQIGRPRTNTTEGDQRYDDKRFYQHKNIKVDNSQLISIPRSTSTASKSRGTFELSRIRDGEFKWGQDRRRKRVAERTKIADTLYGDVETEIEDLTPDQRDVLVRHAFKHYALRARIPTVWIPNDDIGVSNDEVKRTEGVSQRAIWISNKGAALDEKSRVIYGTNPPDFAKTDYMAL